MAPKARYESKGYNVRGILTALEKEGILAQVRARVPDDVKVLIDTAPMAGAWVPGDHSDALSQATLEILGEEGLRRVALASVRQGAMVVVRPVVDSLVRLVGVSPASLLGQMARITATAVRGLEHRYEATGPTTGFMHVTVAGHPPESFFILNAAALETAFEMCGVQGTIRAGKATERGAESVARHDVSWTARR